MFQGCFRDALGMFGGCFGDVLGIFLGCVGDVFNMFMQFFYNYNGFIFFSPPPQPSVD